MSSVEKSKPQYLAGKVAIVTGGSRGIGAGIAIELAQRGAKVFLNFFPLNVKAIRLTY